MRGSSRFQQNRFSSQSLTRTIFKSRSSLIVHENVILNRTVVVDSDSQQWLSTTTVLFRTTFTGTIKLNLLLKWLLGSNLSQRVILLTRGLTRDLPCEQRLHFRGMSWRAKGSLCRQPFNFLSCMPKIRHAIRKQLVRQICVSFARIKFAKTTCEQLSSSFCFVFLLRSLCF